MTCIDLLTAGESHGLALVAIVKGVPAGVPVSEEEVNLDLARRQVGYGRGGRMSVERDIAVLVGGVRHGVTLGSPVCLQVSNRDWENWREEMSPSPAAPEFVSRRRVDVPRPGHADLAGVGRFGHDDMRNVLERSSARETAARVAGGAVCKALLGALNIEVRSYVQAIGGVEGPAIDPFEPEVGGLIESSDVRCADAAAADRMREAIDAARADGDTVGGLVAVEAEGLPPGLGSCATWDARLDARLAAAMMSIQAIKSVEVGLGREVASARGSDVHDPILPGDGRWWRAVRPSNRAGGIEGGMSNGERVILRLGMKPIPTLTSPLPSVLLRTGAPMDAHSERSDVCAVPAACIVAEAMMALVLADALVEKLGNGCLTDIQAAYRAYRERLRRTIG